MSTAVYYLSAGFTSFHYTISAVLAVLFVGGHMFLARAAVQTGIPISVFMLVSLLVFAVNLSIFQTGLENTLLFFLLSMFIWMQFWGWKNRTLEIVSFAMVLGLIYFARLDSIFFIALYLPWYAVRQWRAGNLAAAVLLPALVTSVVVAHLLFMLISFDTIFPTSQVAIKEFLAQFENSNLVEAFSPAGHQFTTRIEQGLGVVGVSIRASDLTSPARFIGLVVPVSLFLGVGIVARRDPSRRFPIVLVGLMAILQLIYYAVALNGWMRPWYFTGWYILVSFAAAYLISRILGKLSVVQTTILILAAMVVIVGVNVERNSLHWTYFADRSEILSDIDNKNNVLVGYTPDIATFFSGVPIRHLEGLMNGYDYLDSYLKQGRVATYLSDVKATHYVLSNSPYLPDYIPCRIEIARDSDGGLRAIGTYDRHNDFIAIYRVSFASGGSGGALDDDAPECGPRTATEVR